MTRLTRFALLCVVSLSMGGAAYAEPIFLGTARITGGSLQLDWTEIHYFGDVSGENFQLVIHAGGLSPAGWPLHLDRRSSFDVALGGLMTLQVGERVWDMPDGSNARLSFHLDTSSVTFTPLVDQPNFGTAVFSFDFNGSLTGVSQGQEVELGLIGQGVGGSGRAVFVEGSFGMRDGNLSFQDTPAVPEPSTLILLGVAAGTAALRRATHRR